METIVKEHAPISLTFGHGDLLPEKADELRCEMLSEITCPEKVSNIVTVTTSNESNNHVFWGNPDNSTLCDNFVAVRNRSSNAVRFYRVNNFFMNPYRKQDDYKVKVPNDPYSIGESSLISSRKSKNKSLAAERNAVNLSDLNETVTQAAENDNSMIESSASSSPVSSIGYLPPCDRSTTDIKRAYKVYDLVSKDILDTLDTITEEVLKMDLVSLASDSRFSSFMMKAAAHIPKNPLHFKLMIFVDRLLAFNKSSPRLLSDKSNTFCSFSEAVHEKLIEDFTIPGLGNRRLRTPAMRDKILCYAMILIMLCCNYEIDIGLLADTVTPVEHKRLPLLLRTLGGRAGRGAPSIYKLKVPIGEPPIMKNRRSTTKLR